MMNPKKPDHDRLAYHVGRINLSGLTMTKVILWLVAITIVSFVIGFGILALSGEMHPSPDNRISPFRHTASYSPYTTTVPLDGATSGHIRITLGAGEISVRGGAPAAALVETTVFAQSPEWQPEITSSVNGTKKTVTVIKKNHEDKEWIFDDSAHTWEIRVGETIPVDLGVELGAGDNSLTLGSLNLAALSVSTGAGDTEIDITRYRGGPYRADIHGGIGDLTLQFDKTSNTRISIHQGVGDITTSGIEQTYEHYTTPGFDPTRPVNEISITQGIGSIQLEAQ